MKVKSIFAISLLAAGAAFADTTEVDTEYVLGVMPISTGSKKQVILSIPWVQEGTGGNVAVSNVVKTAGLTAGTDENSLGDTLTWYNTSEGKYETWRLVNRNGVYYWKESSTVTDTLMNATDPSAAKFKQGEAMVLTMTGTPASTLYVVGQVGTSATISTVLAANGYTLVAPPTVPSSSDKKTIDFNSDITWGGDEFGSVAIGDMIIADYEAGFPISYTNDVNGTGRWVPTFPSTSGKAEVLVGKGFWYKRVADSPLTIQWAAPTASN